jgi:hypothetical protein
LTLAFAHSRDRIPETHQNREQKKTRREQRTEERKEFDFVYPR